MYAGFSLLLSLFGSQSSTNDDQKENRRRSLLTPEERVLYDKIVSDLFQSCSEIRVEHPKLSPKTDGTPPAYAIIFRQAQSWTKVDDLFNRVSDSIPEIASWKKDWSKRIQSLRDMQELIHKAGKEILALQTSDFAANGELSPSTIDSCQQKRLLIRGGKAKINTLICQATDALENESKKTRLKSNVAALKVLKFLKENWLHLTVFAEWAEVPMNLGDGKRLFVQVRRPIGTKVDDTKFINLSTRAIFTIEETAAETQVRRHDPDSEPFILTRPKEMGMKKQSIAHSPPTTRRTSSVILRSENFIDLEYVDDVKQSKPAMSTIGDRLHTIVNLALDEVNAKLAKHQQRENLTPPSSTTAGPRLDVSVRIPRGWSS